LTVDLLLMDHRDDPRNLVVECPALERHRTNSPHGVPETADRLRFELHLREACHESIE